MSGNPADWTETEALVRELLATTRGQLSQETTDSVERYLDHAEYEMALEGLLLDVMDLDARELDVDWSVYERLCQKLKLDSEQVFDGDFWRKFKTYISRVR